MKIYTKTGDKGLTSLVGGERVFKSDVRVNAYGTCDEANSLIGLALSHMSFPIHQVGREIRESMYRVQTDLFHVGAELSTPSNREVKWEITEESIHYLENLIDKWDKQIPPLKNFILPGGSKVGAGLHVARTVVRRAERLSVQIRDEINPLALQYLNRLSDFLFCCRTLYKLFIGKRRTKFTRRKIK